MYIDDKLCLKDKDIIVRKFSIDNWTLGQLENY
jgi:hypothetical protein